MSNPLRVRRDVDLFSPRTFLMKYFAADQVQDQDADQEFKSKHIQLIFFPPLI